MERRTTGALLLVGSLVLALGGWLLWQRATTQNEEDALAAAYERAIHLDNGRPELAATVDLDPDVDRTVPIALFAIAALGAVCGTIVLASTPSGLAHDGDQ